MLNSKTLPWMLLVTMCVSAIAFQSNGMAALGITRKDVEGFLGKELEPENYLPSLSTAARQAAKAMGQEPRAAVVREAGAIVKSIVMSDAFQKLHAQTIKDRHGAVDHGIDLKASEKATAAKAAADLDKTINDAKRQTAIQMTMMFRGYPDDTLKQMFTQAQQKWNEQLKDKDAEPEEKAMAQRLLARAKTVGPLMQSNFPEFKKQFTLLLSVEMGGPDTEAGLTGAASAAADDQQARTEQQYWDQYNFKVVLRKKLNDFIAIASTVDFAAQTTAAGGRTVFTNAAYERKTDLWKTCFRAGRAPTTAALDIARAWVKEL